MQRARQNVALALTEVNLARADYNAATSAMARAAANQRLITANIALSIADKQATAATAAYTVASTAAAGATTRLAAAKAMLARVGTGLLGALGGPVGLAVMLATVAAGYLLTRNSTEESTKSLRENNDSVGDAIKKYKELDEVKRRSQLVTEKESLRELAGEYDNINTKLITATYSLSRHNDMTTEQSKEVNALVAEYKKTGNIEDFSSKINNLTTVNQASKDGFNKLAGEVKGAGDQFKNQKTFVDQLVPSFKNAGDQAKKTAVDVSELSEKLKDFNKTLADKKWDADFTGLALSKTKFTESQIKSLLEVTTELRKKGIALDSDAAKQMYAKAVEIARINEKNQATIDARNEAEKKVTSEKEKQAKLDEKKYQYSTSELKMLQKVAELSAKADLDTIGSKYGIPKNYLAGLMAQESKGDPNAVSPTGAIGYFQTTAAYRKDNGISVADSKNLPVIAEVVSKNLAKAYKELGNWEAAIRSHNAGLTGSKQFEDNGRVNGSAARNKEVANFSSSVNKWIVGLGGSDLKAKGTTDSIGDLKEYLDFLKEQAAKQKEIELVGASEIIKIRSKLADDIKEIEQAGFSPERTAELKAEYQKRADIDIQIAEAAHSDKLSGYSDYMKSEEQLLNESYARRQRDLKFDLTFTADEYKKASLLLEGERDKELQKARWRALEAREAMTDQIKGLSGGADNIFAKATMSPSDYAKWSLENDRSNAQVDLKKQRVRTEKDIKTSDSFDTEDDRYQALLDSHKEYRDGLAAIDVDYHQKAKELESQQYTDTLSMYGSLLSQAGSVWGSMTEMVKNSAGESSAIYKTMFLAQQAIAIGQAIINTEVGATAALKVDPTGFMSMMTRGLGYASVGLIASQTIAGMAHDGIDNIPKEGTWLLDKGERVVDSRTNSDLKNYLAEGGGGSGDVHISQSITFADGGAKVDTEGQKEIAQSLNNMMDAWARRESRQGGVLHKLARG